MIYSWIIYAYVVCCQRELVAASMSIDQETSSMRSPTTLLRLLLPIIIRLKLGWWTTMPMRRSWRSSLACCARIRCPPRGPACARSCSTSTEACLCRSFQRIILPFQTSTKSSISRRPPRWQLPLQVFLEEGSVCLYISPSIGQSADPLHMTCGHSLICLKGN